VSLKLQNTDINALDLYTGTINKAYLGSTLVYGSEVAASGIYDNASVVYSLRRPDMATKWTNAVLKIRRSSDDATAFVFFDGDAVNDTITLSSLISTTSNTTPDATTLTTFVGANDAYVEQWIGITPDNSVDGNKVASQTTTANQPQFISSGAIITKNGKPTIDFLSDYRWLEASANTDLDVTNSYTILSVSNNILSADNGGLLATGATSISGLLLYNSRATNKRHSVIVATGGNLIINTSVQHNVADQKLLTTVVDNLDMDIYYNGTSDGSGSFTGTYVNDRLKIGILNASNNRLQGTIQEIIIMPSDVTADLTTLHADINAYYSIYV